MSWDMHSMFARPLMEPCRFAIRQACFLTSSGGVFPACQRWSKHQLSQLSMGHGCGSKPMGSHFGVGEFTTHFRTYFRGDWDVHWGYGSQMFGDAAGLQVRLASEIAWGQLAVNGHAAIASPCRQLANIGEMSPPQRGEVTSCFQSALFQAQHFNRTPRSVSSVSGFEGAFSVSIAAKPLCLWSLHNTPPPPLPLRPPLLWAVIGQAELRLLGSACSTSHLRAIASHWWWPGPSKLSC